MQMIWKPLSRPLSQPSSRDEETDTGFDKDRREVGDWLVGFANGSIEDMVAPCGFQLSRTLFGDEEAETCAIRIKRKHPRTRAEIMEIDLLAIGPAKVFVVDVKRRVDAGKIAEYQEKLRRLPEFFPELAGKTLLAAVASVYLEPSLIAGLNREKLYGIAMGEEVTEIVNLGQF